MVKADEVNSFSKKAKRLNIVEHGYLSDQTVWLMVESLYNSVTTQKQKFRYARSQPFSKKYQ